MPPVAPSFVIPLSRSAETVDGLIPRVTQRDLLGLVLAGA